MSKVLIISPDTIAENMAGPGIRYWNFAKELSKHFEVVLFSPNVPDISLKNVRMVQLTQKNLRMELNLKPRCVLTQGSILWFHSYIKRFNVPLIIDLYDPFVFENLELFSGDSKMHRSALSIMLDQLSYGDYFICASEKQRDLYLGMLTALNRINPEEYKRDKTLNHLIGLVPFGIPDYEPLHSDNVLKGVLPGVGKQDKLLIWGGGIWDWLDPLTAVRGMHIIRKTRSDVKLFFMGIKPPNPKLLDMKHAQKLVHLSDTLGLTDSTVFFNSWTPYNYRHRYLLEADIGINLHYSHIETRYAFRTRMLDYIWCNLPVVSTKGDVLSELLEEHHIGKTIPCDSPEDFAATVLEVLDNYDKYIVNTSLLKKSLTWEVCTKDLIQFCREPTLSHSKKNAFKIRGGVNGKYHYYLLKISAFLKEKRYKDLMQKIRNR